MLFQEVGSIIGKKGEIVKRFRDEVSHDRFINLLYRLDIFIRRNKYFIASLYINNIFIEFPLIHLLSLWI